MKASSFGGIQLFYASTEGEINAAFAGIAQAPVHAVLVASDAYFISRRDQIVGLAARYAIPACYSFREFTVAGGL